MQPLVGRFLWFSLLLSMMILAVVGLARAAAALTKFSACYDGEATGLLIGFM